MKPISADETMVVPRSHRGDIGRPSSRSQSPWWKNSAAQARAFESPSMSQVQCRCLRLGLCFFLTLARVK